MTRSDTAPAPAGAPTGAPGGTSAGAQDGRPGSGAGVADEGHQDLLDRYRSLVDASPNGIVVHQDGVIRFANAAAHRISQVPDGGMVGRAVLDFLDADDVEPTLARLASLTEAGMSTEPAAATLVLPGGRRVPIESICVRTTWGGRPAYQVILQDITDWVAAREQLERVALTDELTGLPNRTAMVRAADAALAERPDRVAALFCDLDRFGEVNELLGYAVGDAVLREISGRLRAIVRHHDVVGRSGSDEFLVLCGDVCPDGARRLGERVAAELSRPLTGIVDESPLPLTLGASVGVAHAADAGLLTGSATELLQAADSAVRQARCRGRGQVGVFDHRVRDEARRRMSLRTDLGAALDAGGLEVHYQPIWRTDADPARCRVAGLEALVRWTHPVQGRQNPQEFVALAEETGLIDQLGRYVLARACARTADLRADGRDLYVSVNLSARQLSDPDLVDSVAGTLARTGLEPAALWLELTETALAEDVFDAAAVLDELVALGVRISIDDFGTGYSSLRRLRHLPVAALKIDRSFVADLTPGTAPDGVGDGGTIAASTIALAHQLDLVAVAEGIETPGQLAALAALGCDLAQGYLLGRPVPADQLTFRPLA